MFIRNELRFNPHAEQVIDGILYPASSFRDPEVLARLGITEIPDPQPPEDYSDKFYYRTEQDTAPYVIYTKKSDEQIAQITDTENRDTAQRHLDDTDYLFTVDKYAQLSDQRKADLTASREAARVVIRDYAVKYPVMK